MPLDYRPIIARNSPIHANAISDDTLIARNPAMIAADTTDHEVIVLDVETGTFLQLNRTAAAIWSLIETPLRLSDLCASIERSFDADRETARRDTVEFLADMRRRGLVEISD
jgi:hypothetical protein